MNHANLLKHQQQRLSTVLLRRHVSSSSWSQSLSFASPDADFCYHQASSSSSSSSTAAPSTTTTTNTQRRSIWSHSLSFCSPDADFCAGGRHSAAGMATTVAAAAAPPATTTRSPHAELLWNHHHNSYSYASPESDFCAESFPANQQQEEDATRPVTFSFCSPEADFCADAFPPSNVTTNESLPIWSETMSFASPESDLCNANPPPDVNKMPLTLGDVLLSPLPMLVTTSQAPHRIVAVNEPWQDLCGYRQEDVIGKSIRKVLQGPLTNTKLAQTSLQELLEVGTSEMYVVNYKQSGKPFVNHVKLGKMKVNNDDESSEPLLVGVMEAVERAPLRMI